MAKTEREQMASLEDAIGAVGVGDEGFHSGGGGSTKKAKGKKRPVEMDSEFVEGSASYYWHSFLLLGGRMLHRTLAWYNGLFSFSTKDKAKLYRNISQYYLRRGAGDRAIGYLKEWVRNEKTDPEPLYQMGCALASMGELQRAVSAFDKALALKANHHNALYRKSAILLKLKKYPEAISGLEAIIDGSPKDARAYYLLGLAHDGAGDLDKGIEALEKAVELDPEEIKYHQYLGFMNVRKEDHQTAAKHFTRVMELERAEDDES
jgi:tetratricopeptide (TPR) repeat protein